MLTITKFGGSSLADSGGFARVCGILRADPARRGAVVSAPGRRFAGDEKLTDLLYRCYSLRRDGRREVFSLIRERILSVSRTCAPALELDKELDALEKELESGISRDFLVSRGEYFSSRILASMLGWQWIDSADWLRFAPDGTADTARSCHLLQGLVNGPFVTPGFYGTGPDGKIRTLSRGGSDVTGALAAAALNADLYENWTDVPGLLRADPALLPEAEPVRQLTYAELREISLFGTQVLHEGAVRPVWEQDIPMQIRSVFDLTDPGTVISSALPEPLSRPGLLCLSGRREQALLSVTGAPPESLGALLRESGTQPGILTGAWDRQTATIPENALHGLLDSLHALPGTLTVLPGMALLAALFDRTPGNAEGQLLRALEAESIPVPALLRPFGSRLLLLAVPDRDYPAAVRAICRAVP